MAKVEWGKKRKCLNCNAKFYDLNKNPIVCPICNTVFDDTNLIQKNKKIIKTQEKVKEASIKDEDNISPISSDILDEDIEDDIEISETESLLKIDEDNEGLIPENDENLDINLDDKEIKEENTDEDEV